MGTETGPVHDGEQGRGEGRDAGSHGRCRLELLSCASPHLCRQPGSMEWRDWMRLLCKEPAAIRLRGACRWGDGA